ncbi:hypothetical protein AALA13_05270 [Lachnospiraceae bacterium 50-23]
MKRVSNAFLEGYFRVLDLKGAKEWPNISNNSTKDYEALRSDWENVGKEIRREAGSYSKA